jgi:hypothetical protein
LHAHAPRSCSATVAPAPALRPLSNDGLAFGITGFMAYFVIWKVVLCHTDLFERSWIQARRYLGGQAAFNVTLMVSDFGRVIYLT